VAFWEVVFVVEGGVVVAGYDGACEHVVDTLPVEACDESFDQSQVGVQFTHFFSW